MGAPLPVGVIAQKFRAFALRQLRRRGVAEAELEDLFQEGLLEMLRRPDRVESAPSALTATQQAMASAAKLARQRHRVVGPGSEWCETVPWDAVDSVELAPEDVVSAPVLNPEEALLQRERIHLASLRFEALPSLERAWLMGQLRGRKRAVEPCEGAG